MSIKNYDDIIKGIVNGKIVNEETGETTCHCHYMFYTGFKIETIVKIQKIEQYTLPDSKWQIDAECLGLNSGGGTFELCLTFFIEHNNDAVKILNDLNSSSLLYVQGRYDINYNDKITMIYNPIYSPLPDDFSESEVNKVFLVNSGKIKKISKIDG